jgi:hypothetical protein
MSQREQNGPLSKEVSWWHWALVVVVCGLVWFGLWQKLSRNAGQASGTAPRGPEVRPPGPDEISLKDLAKHVEQTQKR